MCEETTVEVIDGIQTSFNQLNDIRRGYDFLSVFKGYSFRSKKERGNPSIYLIEMSDGCVKIGKSTNPEARIKTIVAGNQASSYRYYIKATDNHSTAEAACHHNFKDSRVGGEFFKVDFNDVVNWIKENIPMKTLTLESMLRTDKVTYGLKSLELSKIEVGGVKITRNFEYFNTILDGYDEINKVVYLIDLSPCSTLEEEKEDVDYMTYLDDIRQTLGCTIVNIRSTLNRPSYYE